MLQKQFENYLSSLGISVKSLKNYKSDISHFLGWAMLKVKTFGSYAEGLSDLVPFLSSKMSLEYRDFMTANSMPPKTINRRLSTLRHLAKFLIDSQISDFNFMDGVQNISDIRKIGALSYHSVINQFTSHLEAEDVSKSTIKNYVSDVRQFLTWLERNHAQPA